MDSKSLIPDRNNVFRGILFYVILLGGIFLVIVTMSLLSTYTDININVSETHDSGAVYVVIFASLVTSIAVIGAIKKISLAESISERVLSGLWRRITFVSYDELSTPQSAEYKEKKEQYVFVGSQMYPMFFPLLIIPPALLHLYTGEIDSLQLSIVYIAVAVFVEAITSNSFVNWRTLSDKYSTRRDIIGLIGVHGEVTFLVVAAFFQINSTVNFASQTLLGNVLLLFLLIVVILLAIKSLSYGKSDE